MRQTFFVLFSLFATSILGCSPTPVPLAQAAPGPDTSRVNFGRRNEPDHFTAICRSELTTQPPVFAVIDFIIEEGGHTCHSGANTVLFVPQRDGRCPRPNLPMSQSRTISVEQASQEFGACVAFGHPGATFDTGVITFQPGSSGEDAFAAFGFNLIAISAHDALPITSLAWSDDVICIETSDPTLAYDRIVESDLADASAYSGAIHRGTCGEIGSRLIGRRWPESGSNQAKP